MILNKRFWWRAFPVSERVRAGQRAGVGCLGSAVASRGWGVVGVVIEVAGGAFEGLIEGGRSTESTQGRAKSNGPSGCQINGGDLASAGRPSGPSGRLEGRWAGWAPAVAAHAHPGGRPHGGHPVLTYPPLRISEVPQGSPTC